MSYRIGFGYDVHPLVDEHPFFLGTVPILSSKGAQGHSDADVLVHAICDAFLGALALGDIGQHFPDTDDKWKGVQGKVLLINTYKLITEKGYQIVNLDSTIALQNPKINTYIPKMSANIADLLNTSPENISIKATTTEKMGFVGRQEGVEAYATVLLKKNS